MNDDKREITFLLLCVLTIFAEAMTWAPGAHLNTHAALMAGSLITLIVFILLGASLRQLFLNFVPQGDRAAPLFIFLMTFSMSAAFLWLSLQQTETKRFFIVVPMVFATLSTALIMMLAADLRWRSPDLLRFTMKASGWIMAAVGILYFLHNGALAAGVAVIAAIATQVLTRGRRLQEAS